MTDLTPEREQQISLYPALLRGAGYLDTADAIEELRAALDAERARTEASEQRLANELLEAVTRAADLKARNRSLEAVAEAAREYRQARMSGIPKSTSNNLNLALADNLDAALAVLEEPPAKTRPNHAFEGKGHKCLRCGNARFVHWQGVFEEPPA